MKSERSHQISLVAANSNACAVVVKRLLTIDPKRMTRIVDILLDIIDTSESAGLANHSGRKGHDDMVTTQMTEDLIDAVSK